MIAGCFTDESTSYVSLFTNLCRRDWPYLDKMNLLDGRVGIVRVTSGLLVQCSEIDNSENLLCLKEMSYSWHFAFHDQCIPRFQQQYLKQDIEEGYGGYNSL